MKCRASEYLSRTPEFLVINGYRNWLKGCVCADGAHWMTVWTTYRDELGPHHGRLAMSGLVIFVNTLGKCATCPLRFLHSDASHLCRDECLVLSLVSSLQHGDEEAERISIEALVAPTRRMSALHAAGTFAASLKSIGCTLMPISADVARSFAIVSELSHGSPLSKTLH